MTLSKNLNYLNKKITIMKIERFVLMKGFHILYVSCSISEKLRKNVAILLIFMPLLSKAYDVEIDGIYYNLDQERCEATVTYESDPFSGDGRTPNSMIYQGDIVIPYSFKYNGLEYKVISIGRCAFMNSKNLTSVEIPQSVISINDGAFSYSSIREIKIGENVKEVSEAFMECNRLHEISFPNSVEILDCSFIHGSIQRISLGTGIKSIPSYFLTYCSPTDVYCFSKNPPATDETSFMSANTWQATLHVPQETIEVYKTTSPWNEFGEIIPLLDEKPGENISKICKIPKIYYNKGKLSFVSETPNAEFVSRIIDNDIKSHYGETIDLSLTYTIKVYAFAEGYENSDEVTATIGWRDGEFFAEGFTSVIGLSEAVRGDLNGDGVIDVADHVKLSDIIMNQK